MRSNHLQKIGWSVLVAGAVFASPSLLHAQDQTQSQASAATSQVPPPPPDAVQPADEKAASGSPKAESGPLPARLSDVEGAVQIQGAPAQSGASQQASDASLPPPPPQDTVFKDATMNMPVLPGMSVSTGNDGRAELQFPDGSFARVTPNSGLTVVSLADGGEQLQVTQGLAYFDVPEAGQGQSALTVMLGTSRVHVPSGTLLRVDADQLPYKLAVIRGSAHVDAQGTDVSFEIPQGQTAVVDPSAPKAYDVQEEIADNSWDQWNTDRDQAQTQIAAGQTDARTQGGNPDAAGWNDLDYYGTWYNVPGQGLAWAPDGVDENFDPYGSGAWGYYGGTGYLWVSSYPWGWLPYRCGGWNYFGGYGWMWRPGGCGGGGPWFPYTGIHHAPAGYRLPLRPADPRTHQRLGGVNMPRSNALVQVDRGPHFDFREVGGSRPEPRPFALRDHSSDDNGGAVAQTLPVLPPNRFSYRSQQPGSGFVQGGGTGGGGSVSGIRQRDGGRFVYTPGPHTITPPPNVQVPRPAAPRPVAPPPARMTAPPMRMAPPPMHMAPPMHMSAPAGRPR